MHVRGMLGLPAVPGEEGGTGGGPPPPQPKWEDKKTDEGKGAGSTGDDVSSPGEEGGEETPLAAALRAKRRDLKPTEVQWHVTHTHSPQET